MQIGHGGGVSAFFFLDGFGVDFVVSFLLRVGAIEAGVFRTPARGFKFVSI